MMSVTKTENSLISKVLYLKALLLIFAGLFFGIYNCFAQTYVLPDTNLRNKLIASYPSVMTGNFLNTTAAGAMTGTLNLSNSNIRNADGIQFFTQITSLNLSANQLDSLPDISGLTQLRSLFLHFNRLTSIPSLSAFSDLEDFQAPYNELTSLPSFAGNLNLKFIYCQNNKLTSLPDISMLTNLEVLDIGNNNFMQLPDLSPLTSLKELHVHQTGIDTLIGLPALSSLTVLWAWGNKIRDLSELNTNTTLVIFQVFDNELTSLPDLSNKPALTSVNFLNNRITFEDILPLTSLPNFSSFSYNPQKRVPMSSLTAREKDNISFNPMIDQSVSNNQYTWYKDGNILTTNSTGVYSIPSVTYADSGKYYIRVSNPSVPGLTVKTDTAILQVKPCLEINAHNKKIISEDCKEGATIQFSFNLGGGIAPFEYAVLNAGNMDTTYQASPEFQSLAPGVYSVIVKDSRMCKASENFTVRKPEGCKSIISPNGDGIMDTYFIEEAGKIKIYDISRKLVKELSGPAEWDGSKSDGSMADDGYYAIVIDEKKVIHVTLVK